MNNKERLRIHRQLFQKLHFCQVSHNYKKLEDILHLIHNWVWVAKEGIDPIDPAEVGRMQDIIMKKLDEI